MRVGDHEEENSELQQVAVRVEEQWKWEGVDLPGGHTVMKAAEYTTEATTLTCLCL